MMKRHPGLGRHIKYAIARIAWFIITMTTASYLSLPYSLVSLQVGLIYFLGGSAYMCGDELLDRKYKKGLPALARY